MWVTHRKRTQRVLPLSTFSSSLHLCGCWSELTFDSHKLSRISSFEFGHGLKFRYKTGSAREKFECSEERARKIQTPGLAWRGGPGGDVLEGED